MFSFSAYKGKNDNTGSTDSGVISSSSSSNNNSSSNISSTFFDNDEVDIDKIVSDNNSLLFSTDLKKGGKNHLQEA